MGNQNSGDSGDRKPGRGHKRSRRGWGEGRVYQLESGRWRAVISMGVATDPATGRRDRVRESETFLTKPEALGWLARKRAEREGRGTPGRQTVGQWVSHWLAVCKASLEHGSWVYYAKRAERLIIPSGLGGLPLSKLTTRDVEDWLAGLDTTPGEKGRTLKTLKASLGAAVDSGVLGRNAARPVKPPKHRVRRIRFWTAGQAREFLAHADGDYFAAYWRAALDTGARPGELFALHWNDVSFDPGRPAVRINKSLEDTDEGPREKPPKTERGNRVVRVAPATVKAILTLREREAAAGRDVVTGPVFLRKRGSRMHRGDMSGRILPELIASAGVPHIGLYDLRHTSATLLLSRGVSLRVIADRLGHESPEITLRHYVGVLPDQQEHAARVAEELFGSGEPADSGGGSESRPGRPAGGPVARAARGRLRAGGRCFGGRRVNGTRTAHGSW